MKAQATSRASQIRALIRTTPAAALVAGIVLGPPPGLEPSNGERKDPG